MINLAYCVYLLLIARVEYRKNYSKKWHKQHPGYSTKSCQEWRKKNPELQKEYSASYYQETKEYQIQKSKAYRQANPERVRTEARERKRRKYFGDPSFKLLKLLRARIRNAIKGIDKSARTLELLGCSIADLRQHIEKQFQPGMTWENHGSKGWHIDHIKPCASFDLTNSAQQGECFHYTNLQPLWAIDNIKKGDR